MLVECCKFGKVIRLVSPEGNLFDHLGCIAVTFENMLSARDCASSLHGRWFDSRQIETMVFSPPTDSTKSNLNSIQSHPPTSSSSSLQNRELLGNFYHENNIASYHDDIITNNGNHNNSFTKDNSANPPADTLNRISPYHHQYNIDTVSSQHIKIEIKNEIEEPDVDDFLNSFL